MHFMKPEDWKRYQDTMNLWQKDAFQQEIIWKRFILFRNKHGEDTDPVFEDIVIKGLLQYNYFRAWAVTQATTTGEIDKETCLLYLNKEYLRENELLTPEGNLNFDPAMDRFIVEGIEHKSAGESTAAQAYDKTLFYFIILKREETNSGNNRY